MTKYDQIVEWIMDHWIGAVLVLIAVCLATLPKVRDGAVLVGSWVKKCFVKKCAISGADPVVIDTGEEKVTFTELHRSIEHDVVKVHAYTHILGVAAEREWIRHRYPRSEWREQRLTTLELLSKKERDYKDGQIYFDVITIKLPDGREKEIYFDISSFFGDGVSALHPKAAIARKLNELYSKPAIE